ncbi:MAG: hypothetical protein OHK0036_01900 [Bacteroidia bacterium]
MPIWEVYLEAPQYPEPIGMYIYIDKIEGIGENDLDNINLLNHYIGMKKIIPESIPELKYMKYAIYFFLASGIVVFILKNKKWILYIWTMLLILSSIFALYDFNKWEQDYGSNLDPKAPIKVPGMTYKPPLIGQKQLLNITATSVPSWGGILFIISIMVSTSSSIIIYFSDKQTNINHDNVINNQTTHHFSNTSHLSNKIKHHQTKLDLKQPLI